MEASQARLSVLAGQLAPPEGRLYRPGAGGGSAGTVRHAGSSLALASTFRTQLASSSRAS
jgi:hypothetical protein